MEASRLANIVILTVGKDLTIEKTIMQMQFASQAVTLELRDTELSRYIERYLPYLIGQSYYIAISEFSDKKDSGCFSKRLIIAF